MDNDRGTVLLVESEPAMCERYVVALNSHGFTAAIVTTRDEALRMLVEESFAAIVFDLQWPQLDGIAILDFLQDNAPEKLRRVLLVTGVLAAEIRLLFPICTTLPKPVLPSRLVHEIERCVDRLRHDA